MNTTKIKFKKSVECSIMVENGIFKNLRSTLEPFSTGTQFIIITDKNIINDYEKLIHNTFQDYQYSIIISIMGEKAKDISNIEKIYSELLNQSCDRKTCLIAFGGGVISDITGFIASTFMRGIEYINIPTSLLGMVDSSIGGKTGINLSKGKNLMGAIYHPSTIVIDPTLLKTLPKREYYAGMVEIIKYSLILDRDLFKTIKDNFNELLENNISDLMLKIITRCVKLKSNIVVEDVEDKNIRNILNFGHTIGHALESYFNYEYINHGEAVAYGILYSSKLSNIYSDLTSFECQEINDLINKIPLPVLKNLNIDKLIKLIIHDKKNTNGKLKFILLKSIGEAQITTKINYNNIKTVLEEHEYISC